MRKLNKKLVPKLLKKKFFIGKITSIKENSEKYIQREKLKGYKFMIEFRNVHKKYETGTVAVEEANFTIEKGEFAFLVGTSGSGKSTLIKMILKEEEPTSRNNNNKWKRYNILKTKESTKFKKNNRSGISRF